MTLQWQYSVDHLIKGKISNKFMFQYLSIIMTIIAGLLVWAGSVHTIPFTFVEVCVSELGDPISNPDGWWIFTIALVFAGVALLPFFIYIDRKMSMKDYPIFHYWTQLPYISSIGLIGVGIFNESMGEIHYFFAFLAFGGLIVAMFLSLGIMGYRMSKKYIWPNKLVFFLVGVVLILIIILVINELLRNGTGDWEKLALTEWYATFSLIVWLFGLLFLKTTHPKLDSLEAVISERLDNFRIEIISLFNKYSSFMAKI